MKRALPSLLLTMCVLYRIGGLDGQGRLIGKGKIIGEGGDAMCWIKRLPAGLSTADEVYVCTHPRRCYRARLGEVAPLLVVKE